MDDVAALICTLEHETDVLADTGVNAPASAIDELMARLAYVRTTLLDVTRRIDEMLGQLRLLAGA